MFISSSPAGGRDSSSLGPPSGCSLLLVLGCNGGAPCVDADAVWNSAPSGEFCVNDDLIVKDRNPQELNPLTRITEIKGSLIFFHNPAVREFPTFSALRRIGGDLSISDNSDLVGMSLSGLEAVDGGIYVADNPMLARLTLSEDLTSATSLTVLLNSRLRVFQSGVSEIEGDVVLSGNGSLETIELATLGRIGGNLYISENPELRRLRLPSLTSAGGVFHLADSALEALATSDVALENTGWVRITDNPSLRYLVFSTPLNTPRLEITDNPNLRSISGELLIRPAFGTTSTFVIIHDNPTLTDLTGLESISEVEFLFIERNELLKEIPNFQKLLNVGGSLRITHNPSLLGPPGWFPALQDAADIRIFDNKSLPPAIVDELLGRITFAGTPRVGDNKNEETALDPCPWENDNICDADSMNPEATHLCMSDPDDCNN